MPESTAVRQPVMLIFQGHLPVDSNVHGEFLYDSIEKFLISLSPTVKVSGQVIQQMQPCCNQKKESV